MRPAIVEQDWDQKAALQQNPVSLGRTMRSALRRYLTRMRCIVAILSASVSAPMSGLAQSALSPPAVSGCYRITDSTGAPPWPSQFYRGAVHLDTILTPRFRAKAGATAELYPMFSHARMTRRGAFDTAFNFATWRIVRQDSVEMKRSDGFTGEVILVASDSFGLRGVTWSFSDVVDPAHPPRRRPVLARRVPCPTKPEGRRAKP